MWAYQAILRTQLEVFSVTSTEDRYFNFIDNFKIQLPVKYAIERNLPTLMEMQGSYGTTNKVETLQETADVLAAKVSVGRCIPTPADQDTRSHESHHGERGFECGGRVCMAGVCTRTSIK
jgi:hypothetical protein